MQPLQYDLRCSAAKDNSITHAAAAPSNLDAGHSNAICNQSFKKRIGLRTQEQPLVAEHRGGIQSRPERPQPQTAHTRGTFHRRLQPLYTEKYKVSCSKLPPQNKAHATFMQPFQCDLQPQLQETHRTTHTGTTTRCRTQGRNQSRPERPQPQPRTHEVPFIAGCSHFTRKNTRFRVPASSPKQNPCNIHASSPLPFVITSLRHIHHFPSSPLPIVTTSLRHHFPSSPLPFLTTSLRHHPVS